MTEGVSGVQRKIERRVALRRIRVNGGASIRTDEQSKNGPGRNWQYLLRPRCRYHSTDILPTQYFPINYDVSCPTWHSRTGNIEKQAKLECRTWRSCTNTYRSYNRCTAPYVSEYQTSSLCFFIITRALGDRNNMVFIGLPNAGMKHFLASSNGSKQSQAVPTFSNTLPCWKDATCARLYTMEKAIGSSEHCCFSKSVGFLSTFTWT
ncbi:hypothetical protein IW262DRAFT_1372199 [Armillaria fumosa]|nr:hypothetical protein IW262DRAFT_1372199 [Armillaria fumosa]